MGAADFRPAIPIPLFDPARWCLGITAGVGQRAEGIVHAIPLFRCKAARCPERAAGTAEWIRSMRDGIRLSLRFSREIEANASATDSGGRTTAAKTLRYGAVDRARYRRTGILRDNLGSHRLQRLQFGAVSRA